MGFYKGGTYIDPYSRGYLFWYNYFSDLGRIVAHSGVPNTISWILFTITLTLWGLSQIPFFLEFPKFFRNSKKLRIASIIGSIFGILTGLFYIGVAFTPSDIIDPLHDFFVVLGFGSIFICIILYSFVILNEKDYPQFYGKIFVISATILGVYYIIILLLVNTSITSKLLILVIGQKIMIYTLLLCSLIQIYGALKHKTS